MTTQPNTTDVEDEVLLKKQGHLAVITLNRPELQNTITSLMLDTLCERLLEAEADPEVRVIVLTGRGRFFCGGLDLRGSGCRG